MAQYQDIDEYREKKRRQKRNRILLALGFLAAALAVFLTVFFLVRNNRKSGLSDDASFPLSIHGEQLTDIHKVGGNLAVLTQSSLYVYDTGGSARYDVLHGCTNPAICESGNRLLTYDRGGTKLRVDDTNGNCDELNAENTILCAQIASDGSVVLVTTHDQYAFFIQVYDAKMNLRYRYGSATESFSMVSFSPDQKHIAACAIGSSSGAFLAKVSVFDYTTEKTARTYEIADLLPLYAAYTASSNLMIIGSDRLVLLNAETGETFETEYDGALKQFVCDADGMTAIATDNQLNGASTLTLFDKNGKQTASVSVPDSPLDLCISDSRVLFLGKKAVYHYDLSLNLQEEITLESSAQKITYANGSMFLLGADAVSKYSIR